jgi:hypothetical protein
VLNTPATYSWDITTAVARIEQAAGLPEGDALREHLIDRLVTCDTRRLRAHLDAEHLAMLDAES